MPGSEGHPEDRTAVLEERIGELRAQLSAARRARDGAREAKIRVELRQVQREYADALDAELDVDVVREVHQPTLPRQGGSQAVPAREQVYQALTILGAPAAPKLISAVHEAFFNDVIVTSRLASLRRDEERSFTAQPYARPYYICSALTYDRLTAARGVLAVSLWPLERRIIGPLGPRVDFLTQAVAIARQIQRIQDTGHEPLPPTERLLRRFATNIPGAGDVFDKPEPDRVVRAAESELDVHRAADDAQRNDAAVRARAQLSEIHRLFGSPGLGALRAAAGDR